jgi:Iron only hydrogenase large subunit, C-terminal domain
LLTEHVVCGPHSPNEVYHVTVMPCYDKKLEASRSDFYNDQYATRDVDCVLTTGELLLLAQEHGVDLSLPIPDEGIPPHPSSAIDSATTPVLPDLLIHPGSSSGSYLHSLMLAVARTYPHLLTLESKTLRNADHVEHTLRDSSSGATVFHGATCYGFRNLQNVVRRVGRAAGVQVGRGAAGRLAGGLRSSSINKTSAAGGGASGTYDYVEVMACPGGCVGGGGQLRGPEKKKARTKEMTTDTPEDAEGFIRHWAAEGVFPSHDPEGPPSLLHDDGAAGEAPWSTRAWTREVERAYWGGLAPELVILPTPPASPKPGASTGVGAGADERGYHQHQDRQEIDYLSSFDEDLGSDSGFIETLIVRVFKELAIGAPPRRDEAGSGAGLETSVGTMTSMNDDSNDMAEAGRRGRATLFRTQYRAVESEVVGLGVKW